MRQPAPEPDPEATVRIPAAEPDPEATLRGPVFDPDATASRAPADAAIAIPSPGRRRNPFAPRSTRDAAQAKLTELGGLNPLVAAANSILGAVPQMGQTLRHPNALLLRKTLRNQVEAFERNARAAGEAEETVTVATYALCALVDETAARTPWGGDWVEQGLLRELRDESGAGERFLALLERMLEDPAGYRDLIELFYVCLVLGFEGRHAQGDGERMARVRDKLTRAVHAGRPRPDGLSERWRAAPAQYGVDAPFLAGAVAVAAVALGALYFGLQASLDSMRAPAPPAALEPAPAPAPVAAAPVPAPPSPPAAPTPAPAPAVTPVAPSPPAPVAASAPAPSPAAASARLDLAEEVRLGLVAMSESAGSTTIELRGAPQFAPGGIELSAGARPVVARLARALDRVDGMIVVAGHADALAPSGRSRFASNRELSLARAQSVAKLIAAGLKDPSRVRAEGRGESEPVAPNDTAEGRARNRRVAIELKGTQ